MRLRRPEASERGIALVVALLVLLVLSMLALVLMTTVSLESKIAGHSSREDAALNFAEAGISEALSQLRAQTIVLGNNPRAVAQIFNTPAGSVPVLGTDSTAVPTLQPAGQWLNYTSASRGPSALTIQYRTDASRSVIYKYDPNNIPHVQTTTGYNIYQITATGKQGIDQRTVVAEFINKPINVLAKGAFVCNVAIDLGSNALVCGHNHVSSTPAGTGKKVGDCTPFETGSGDLSGVWTTDTLTYSGGGVSQGVPAASIKQTGFYPGPWAMLNMTQAEFFSWVGPPQATPPSPLNGVVYLDNDGISQNQSMFANFSSVDSEGLLYIDGTATINNNFTYRGLVYVEGDLKINGNVWILGGLVVRGMTTIKIAGGGAIILYSSDTIQQEISKFGGQFVNISWREL